MIGEILSGKDMEILKEIKETLALQDPGEKESRLDSLSYMFEYSHRTFNLQDVVEGVHLLLTAAFQEENEEVKEAFFQAITSAVVYYSMGRYIDWDALVASLPTLHPYLFPYALPLLGASQQEKYLPVLDFYTHHSDPEISSEATEALDDLKYGLARVTDSQQEG